MDLQCWVHYCCTVKWFRYTYIYLLFKVFFSVMFYHRKLTTVPCSPQQSLVVDQGTLVLLLKQLGQKSDHKRMKLLLPRSCVPVEVATVLTGQLRQQRLREGVTERFQLSQEWQLGSRWKSSLHLGFWAGDTGNWCPPPHTPAPS